MSDRILVFDRAGEPEIGAPAPERLIAGEPVHRTWNIEDDGRGLYAGFWESTPGEWRIEYTEWEFCQIVSGRSVVTEEGGAETALTAGDALVLRPGFKGTWRVIETTLKHYVIKL
ncbi:cupin [Aureimonas sp. Leaf454]|uniref:cupin domain-containing protein n=1 Tax=Aureimonas sp. Leaf454 TaxID=1736381 RepID=UPI0006FF2EFE|nr:cupin domain-containing protein [Aureimonas sp. Leaf454]KQT50740.1 cupin [Aureimonas sp. Leaf454]